MKPIHELSSDEIAGAILKELVAQENAIKRADRFKEASPHDLLILMKVYRVQWARLLRDEKHAFRRPVLTFVDLALFSFGKALQLLSPATDGAEREIISGQAKRAWKGMMDKEREGVYLITLVDSIQLASLARTHEIVSMLVSTAEAEGIEFDLSSIEHLMDPAASIRRELEFKFPEFDRLDETALRKIVTSNARGTKDDPFWQPIADIVAPVLKKFTPNNISTQWSVFKSSQAGNKTEAQLDRDRVRMHLTFICFLCQQAGLRVDGVDQLLQMHATLPRSPVGGSR